MPPLANVLAGVAFAGAMFVGLAVIMLAILAANVGGEE